jgi:hypothetical protein
MSQITELASSQINAVDAIVVELVEADETPAVVIVRWPRQADTGASAAFPRHRSRHSPSVR